MGARPRSRKRSRTRKSAGRRVSWEALSASAAVLGLAVAVAFNGLQVRHGTNALREARTATELQLLTQLQTVLKRSVYGRFPYIPEIRALRNGTRSSVSPAAERAVKEETADLDYLAWLVTTRHLTTGGADELWGPVMVCEWRQAILPVLGQDVASSAAPNLRRFVAQRGSEYLRLRVC
jgi:hypothetical protein